MCICQISAHIFAKWTVCYEITFTASISKSACSFHPPVWCRNNSTASITREMRGNICTVLALHIPDSWYYRTIHIIYWFTGHWILYQSTNQVASTIRHYLWGPSDTAICCSPWRFCSCSSLLHACWRRDSIYGLARWFQLPTWIPKDSKMIMKNAESLKWREEKEMVAMHLLRSFIWDLREIEDLLHVGSSPESSQIFSTEYIRVPSPMLWIHTWRNEK